MNGIRERDGTIKRRSNTRNRRASRKENMTNDKLRAGYENFRQNIRKLEEKFRDEPTLISGEIAKCLDIPPESVAALYYLDLIKPVTPRTRPTRWYWVDNGPPEAHTKAERRVLAGLKAFDRLPEEEFVRVSSIAKLDREFNYKQLRYAAKKLVDRGVLDRSCRRILKIRRAKPERKE